VATRDSKTREQRATIRRTLAVPVRLTVPGRAATPIDGQTLDVSEGGLGIKLASGPGNLAPLLEDLVEDRQTIEITLRLEQGSVSNRGHLVWWGLLGDDPRFAVRAGILLSEPWAESDWRLIDKSTS
jgi:hypothetical protein